MLITQSYVPLMHSFNFISDNNANSTPFIYCCSKYTKSNPQLQMYETEMTRKTETPQ